MPYSVRQVAVAYLYRGRAEFAKHEPEQAIGDYTRAIAIDPRLAAAFSERGSVYLSLHRIDLAISDCAQAIEINPSNAVYRYNCGNAYWHGSLFSQAIAEYDAAIQLQPNFPLAYMNRGLAEADHGSTDAALRDLTESIRLDASAHGCIVQSRSALRTIRSSWPKPSTISVQLSAHVPMKQPHISCERRRIAKWATWMRQSVIFGGQPRLTRPMLKANLH